MFQILFLDTAGEVSNLVLKKKKFRRKWIFLEKFRFFLKELAKNGSKNPGLKADTTSSSSKFCQDSKNVRVFYVGPVAVLENRDFLSQGGTKIGVFAKKVYF